MQALIANYLRQHGVTTPRVTVAEVKSDNVDDYLSKNPAFMHEALVYYTPPRAPTAQIVATDDLQMSLMPEEVHAGTPVSAEPSETSLVKQAVGNALPPG